MSFHTDHLHPNTGVGTWFLFLSENIVSLLRYSQKRDKETLQYCRTNEGDPPLGSEGGFNFLNRFVVDLRVNCILILCTALHPCLIYKTKGCCFIALGREDSF